MCTVVQEERVAKRDGDGNSLDHKSKRARTEAIDDSHSDAIGVLGSLEPSHQDDVANTLLDLLGCGTKAFA